MPDASRANRFGSVAAVNVEVASGDFTFQSAVFVNLDKESGKLLPSYSFPKSVKASADVKDLYRATVKSAVQNWPGIVQAREAAFKALTATPKAASKDAEPEVDVWEVSAKTAETTETTEAESL